MVADAESAVRVAVASFCPALVRSVQDKLASDRSMRCGVHRIESLEASAGSHLLIIDDSPGTMRRRHHQTIARLPRRQTLYVNAIDEARVAWLIDHGADDAVVMQSQAFGSRVRAAAHRARQSLQAPLISLGDVTVERDRRRVWCAGRNVHLTPLEFSVLLLLLRDAPMHVHTDRLIEQIWENVDRRKAKSAVHVYISYLRQKLAHSRLLSLEHVRGRGYHFEEKVGMATHGRRNSA